MRFVDDFRMAGRPAEPAKAASAATCVCDGHLVERPTVAPPEPTGARVSRELQPDFGAAIEDGLYESTMQERTRWKAETERQLGRRTLRVFGAVALHPWQNAIVGA